MVNVRACKDREEWKKERHKGIGGSDASAVMGLNPYSNQLDIWRDKVGLAPNKTEEEDEDFKSAYLEYGTKAEDPIRNLFMLDYPQFTLYHNANAIFYRTDKDYMCGSLDGYLVANEDIKITSYYQVSMLSGETDVPDSCYKTITKGMKGILEIKTTEILSSMHKEKWHNQVPVNYYIQLLHYMNVMNADFAILRVKLKTVDRWGIIKHSFRDYVFLRSDVEEDLAEEEQAITDFWEKYVETKQEPPIKINI